MTGFTYWAYGLHVLSEIEFPELYPITYNKHSDLIISVGECISVDESSTFNLVHRYESTEHACSIDIRSIALYTITNGSHITIHPYVGSKTSDVRVYCLSNAFAAILHQRRMLPMHAGALLINEKLSFIMGDSGAGKSTLLFQMMQAGYQVFSDDVVVFSFNQKQEVFAASSYPMMKLWKQQFLCMHKEIAQPVRSGVEKYPFYFHDQFHITYKKIERLVVVRVDDQLHAPLLRTLKPSAAITCLLEHVYRREYLSTVELHYHLPLLANLVNSIEVYELIRPRYKSTEKELHRLLISIL